MKRLASSSLSLIRMAPIRRLTDPTSGKVLTTRVRALIVRISRSSMFVEYSLLQCSSGTSMHASTSSSAFSTNSATRANRGRKAAASWRSSRRASSLVGWAKIVLSSAATFGWPGVVSACNAGSPRRLDNGKWRNQTYVDKVLAALGGSGRHVHPINPTHVMSFYGLKCWWNDETNELAAYRPWLDWLVPVLGQLHCAFSWRAAWTGRSRCGPSGG